MPHVACSSTHPRRQSSSVAISALLMLSILNLSAISAVGAASRPLGPFHPAALRSFISARCNSNNSADGGTAVWSYEGCLVDPTNGRTVAEVEGIELCRHLAEVRAEAGGGPNNKNKLARIQALRQKARGLRRMGSLKARDMLLESTKAGTTNNDNKEQSWDYATTVLSRRLFVYRAPPSETTATTNPTDGNNPSSFTLPPSLLRSIRLHPNSPEKKLGLQDTVAVYDVATTYVSRDRGRNMAILTEFPNGNWVMGSADAEGGRVNQATSNSGGECKYDMFDFAVYARMGGGGGKNKKAGPCLIPIRVDSSSSKGKGKRRSGNKSSGTRSGGSVVVSPPRTRLIQFGKDSSVERARYGVRETYSFERLIGDTRQGGAASGDSASAISGISNRIRTSASSLASRIRSVLPASSQPISIDPIVRYTRYGESPPWYRPSQPATLELKGKRIPSIEFAPSLAASIASRYVPGFLAVDCSIPTGPSGEDILMRRKKKRSVSKQDDMATIQMLQDEADAAAVRAVEWFRDPSSNGGEIVTLLDESNDVWEEHGDPFASAGLRGYNVGWKMRKGAKKAIATGGRIAGRIWDATVVTSTSSSSSGSTP